MMFIDTISGGLFYALNDKNFDVVTEILSQGIVINATSLEVVGRFHPVDNEFIQPHDMAVSPDGTSVYVVELIRSHIRKFELGKYKIIFLILIEFLLIQYFLLF